MTKLVDMAGRRYGKLIVVCRAGSLFAGGRAARAAWHCECDCGEFTTVSGGHLREGSVVSCGCKRDASQYGNF
jgi:hypothetical protein